MGRLIASFYLAMLAPLLFRAQQPLPDLFPKNEQTVHGRIVLYDWHLHKSTSGDDFIVRITDPKQPYVRIAYKPFWGFDAPPSKPEDKLDERAFIGPESWSFTVHIPMSFDEKGGCESAIMTHKVVDENGKVVQEMPRYMPTPGAATEKTPSIEKLPCFILNRGGLRPESQPKR